MFSFTSGGAEQVGEMTSSLRRFYYHHRSMELVFTHSLTCYFGRGCIYIVFSVRIIAERRLLLAAEPFAIMCAYLIFIDLY